MLRTVYGDEIERLPKELGSVVYDNTHFNFSLRSVIYHNEDNFTDKMRTNVTYSVENSSYFFKRTDTGDDFHGCGEIDIMEIFDHPDTLGSAHTEHYWAPGWTDDMPKTKSTLGENYIIPGFQYGQYQEYSCVWNEYGLYYYVNGELAKANINIAPVEDVNEAFIKFTCYIGPKGSNAFYGEVEDKDLPQTLYVDWLRVYK